MCILNFEASRRSVLAVVFAVVFVPLVGCGGNSKLGSVHGKVTLEGQPLSGATIEFAPTGGRSSYGSTNEEGEYTLSYTPEDNGAEIGQHVVTIKAGGWVDDPATGGTKEVKETLPAKYNAKTELKADVKAGDNEVNFDLTKK